MPENAVAESRINREIAGTMHLGDRGLELANLDQVLELAKMMAISGPAVPKHLRGQPGVCLGVIAHAARMGLDPFAAAAKSYVVNDQLAYEAQLFAAIANTHPTFKQRPEAVFDGEGANRRCTITGTFRDGAVRQYTSPRFADIQPKNSPLWKNDPDQQLFYTSIRAFIRRWCPEIMLGIKDAEELREVAMTDVTPKPIAEPAKAIPRTLDEFAAGSSSSPSSPLEERPAAGGPEPTSGSAPADAANPLPAASAGSRAELVEKLLGIVTDEKLSREEKLENLDLVRPLWMDNLAESPAFVVQCFDVAAKVARGELKPAAARKYLAGLS